MEQINIHAAKTHLSSLVEKAASGEPFIIAKSGRPLVIVIPYKNTNSQERIGFLKDEIAIPEDFDRMGEDEINIMFGGLQWEYY